MKLKMDSASTGRNGVSNLAGGRGLLAVALALLFSVGCLNAADGPSGTAPAEKATTAPGIECKETAPGGASTASSEAATNTVSNKTALRTLTIQTAADEPYRLKNQAYQTSTLFTTKSITRDGMGECTPKVYKGNAYGVYMRQGDEVIMVAKVPLDGSAAVTLPLSKTEKTAPSDNHCLYILDVDRSGYIHVCGGMHSSKINYWRSDRPEDISSFTHIAPNDSLPPETQPCPIAGGITFPLFFSDRHGQLFWTCQQGCGPLCSYDETRKLWTALGKPLSTVGAGRNRADNISFYYTEYRNHNTTDTTVERGGMAKKHFSVAWDSHNRMHMVFGMLYRNGYKETHVSENSVLYAYSDDGGKTAFKSNGEQIQLPIRTEKGPHQGEVIVSEGQGQVQIAVDKADRPMIWCQSQTGDHCFRLESGRWVDHPATPGGKEVAIDPSGVAVSKHYKGGFARFWPPDGGNCEILDLPVIGYDREHYRDTGELVWTALHGSHTSATYTMHRTVFDRVKT